MPDSFPGLRDRLAALGVLGRPGPAAAERGGPTFEIRRSACSTGEVFGRQGAPASESGVIYHRDDGAGGRNRDDSLADAEAVVTFNGRRFDWPILEARYIMCRMRLDPPLIHDDLMSAARRLWYRPLGTYRFSAIERALCIDRSDDIESWQIPGIYLDYLRTGDTAQLDAVFAHNRQDVACLLHLRRRVRRWIEAGEDPPAPVDWEGLGVLRLQAADGARAEDSFRRALTVEDDPAVRWRIATRLARLLRRASRWEDLLALWQRDLGGRGAWRVRALIEVAKVYQRRFRLPARAVAALEDAVAIIDWLTLREDRAAPALELEVSGRLSRLRAQLSRF